MHSVYQINKNFNFPRIEMSTLAHPKYGEYRVLNYTTTFFGNSYVKTELYFFYKGFGYTIFYTAREDQFEKYLPDFQKILASFEIKE